MEKVITAEIKVNFPLKNIHLCYFKDATKIPPNMEILSNLRCHTVKYNRIFKTDDREMTASDV